MKIPMELLMSQLGNPGRYQVCVFLLLAFNYIPVTFNHLVMAFFGSTPVYFCTSPDLQPPPAPSGLFSLVTTHAYRAGNLTIVGVDFGKCASTYHLQNGGNMSVGCAAKEASKWTYVKEQQESTIVTEWDLVCDSSFLAKVATTVYFSGVMVGGLVFGILADKLGRKPVMLLTLYVPILIGVGISFSNSYILFIVLRFLQGVFMQGLQTSTYVLAMELFLPQYRGVAGAVLECYWGVSVVTLAGVAYLLQSWRYIQLAISLPSLLALPYFWLIPESPRWLLTRHRFNDAEKWISKMARFNKLEYPTQLMEDIRLHLDKSDALSVRQYTFMDLVATPRIRARSLILFYLWFAVAVGYYGLSLSVTSLPGNKYFNFATSGSVELVAFILVVIIIKRFGRRKCLLFFFMIGASACITAGVISFYSEQGSKMSQLSTGFAIFGKFGMGGVFSLTFLYTSELYPTVIRNIGMGSCAFWARFGGVVAPLVLMLGDVTHKSISVVVFGCIALIGGFVTLLLPETLGQKLPDTIEDTESLRSYTLDQYEEDAGKQKLTLGDEEAICMTNN
ncbi:organic cation transporter protein-like [Mizuhopecten yessoensis]|uniref:Organic cation transporter protein n=1 Tax=Mizuhopecten yessoensis TaxID=6573 RepID=A0A210PYM3_MIZYE|nr:organic cation transporter protein-like [Mizuhopecten yessoensis]XP_021371704.1 organic cation transporter protein-like [Mizuhopecten yessoensis]OWF41581.1 Organic cation transporter protein [Mizuhopecten yessoensis]